MECLTADTNTKTKTTEAGNTMSHAPTRNRYGECLEHHFAPNHNDTVTVADFNNNRARILVKSVFSSFVKVKKSLTFSTEND